jgi:flagellar P-ring protein FlgI
VGDRTATDDLRKEIREVMKSRIYLAAMLGFFCLASSAYGVRLKDIASFRGMRNNQLVGYGLVVGLNGTGDGTNTEFTIRSIVNMMERMGIHIEREKAAQVKVKNVAAVMVTATLPPFSRIGGKIDVLVSSLGDAKSLGGGTLLMTPLKGADQQVYAIAQGPIVTGGFAAFGASGSGVQKNHPTVGMITKGGLVEKEVSVALDGKRELTLCLFNPDFTTGEKIKEVINRYAEGISARCIDSGTLSIPIPESQQQRVAEWIASLERLEVVPDTVARVILNEKTGTVVMGENVRISTVAIAHGNLSIQVKEKLAVSQPLPLAPGAPMSGPSTRDPARESGREPAEAGNGALLAPGGATVVTPESSVSVKEEGQSLMILPSGVSLGEVIRALNAIGASPRDLISILQSIKAAGALQADLEII